MSDPPQAAKPTTVRASIGVRNQRKLLCIGVIEESGVA